MTWEQAQRKAVDLWGYRACTVTPHEYAIDQVFQVGRMYYLPNNGARIVVYGEGPSFEVAFRKARHHRSGR